MTQLSIAEIAAPPLLAGLKGWLCWRLETRDNSPKKLKISYYANGKVRYGVNGSEGDIAQLTDFETAKKAAREHGMTGVGFAPLPHFGVTILDFDNCVRNGEVDFAVASMVAGTYAEYSPSGNGVHAIVLGDLGNRKSISSNSAFGFETFASKNYVTFTGRILPINELTGSAFEINPPSSGVLALHMERFGQRITREQGEFNNATLGLTDADIKNLLQALPNDLGYDEWVTVGMALHHETDGAGFSAWDDWSALSLKYTTPDYGLERWESFGRNMSGHSVTARTLIKLANEYGAKFQQVRVTDDDFEVIERQDDAPTNFFKIQSIQDFLANAKPLEWLIKGFLPKASLGVLFGESGSGKSFIALDICYALARGTPWNELKTTKVCRVLYVVAEGAFGFSNRLRAYRHQNNMQDFNHTFDIICEAPVNLIDLDNVSRLLRDIGSRPSYDLIVMDTFAQVTPGMNENSGEDVGVALAHCLKISKIAKGMVLLVHHSGKDASKGARGWSGLRGAADVMLEVLRDGDQRELTVYKQKDGIDGVKFNFRLLPVILEQDADGDDISSCIGEYYTGKPKESELSEKNKRLGRIGQQILYELHNSTQGELYMEQEALMKIVAEKLQFTGGRDRRGNTVARALENLCAANEIFIDNGHIYLPGSAYGLAY